MTREELRDYVEEQRSLNMIPYHVYSTLIDGIDTLEQEPKIKALGEELRSVRNGIKDENVLVGYNMAVAICNKYLEVRE